MKKIFSIFIQCYGCFENYKSKFIISNIMILFIIAISVVEPFLYADLITSLYNLNRRLFISSLIYIIFCYFIKIILTFVKEEIDILIKRNVASNVKNKLMRDILITRPDILDNYSQGKLLSIVYSDSLSIRDIVYTISYYIRDFLVVIIVGIIMIKLNAVLSIIVIMSFPLVSYINKKYGVKINNEAKEIREKTDIVLDIIKKNIISMDDIKYSNSIEKILKQFSDKLNSVIAQTIYCDKLNLNSSTLCNGCSFIGNIIFLIIGGSFVLNYKLSAGYYVAYLSYAKTFSNSLYSISTMYTKLQEQIVCAERALKFFETCNLSRKYENQKIDIKNKYDIGFDSVLLEKNKNKILEDYQVKIPEKSKVILIGKNGSGKTSILNLISGIYQVTNGELKIGDENISNINFDNLITNISYARQTPIIYEMSIKENLLLSDESNCLTEEKLYEICKDFLLLEDILKMENKFDTIINEKYNLSTGQKKKIQLIRCILRKSPIILLDEPLANMDEEFKGNFNDILKKYFNNKTVIIATHDSETFNYYDMKIILSKKKIFI